MDGLPMELITTAPLAAVILFLVMKFLAAMKDRDELMTKMQERWNTDMTKLASSATDSIDRNTAALMHNAAVIERCRIAGNGGGKTGAC